MPKTKKPKIVGVQKKRLRLSVPSDFRAKNREIRGAAKANHEAKQRRLAGLPPLENGKTTLHLLKRWKKGQSGNPTGRPRGQRLLSRAYKHMLAQIEPDSEMTYAELIAYGQIVSAAYKGNTAAAKEIADRTEGTSPQKIKLEAEGSLSLQSLSDEELDAQIEEVAQQIKRVKKDAPAEAKEKSDEANVTNS